MDTMGSLLPLAKSQGFSGAEASARREGSHFSQVGLGTRWPCEDRHQPGGPHWMITTLPASGLSYTLVHTNTHTQPQANVTFKCMSRDC